MQMAAKYPLTLRVSGDDRFQCTAAFQAQPVHMANSALEGRMVKHDKRWLCRLLGKCHLQPVKLLLFQSAAVLAWRGPS